MEKRWIAVREVAEYLSLHYKSIYRLIDSGEIPAVRIGGSVRVDFKRLEKILETQNPERAND